MAQQIHTVLAQMAEQLWTIGHSTHTQLQLMDLLQQHNMQVLVDVRTIPRSTKNPQFNKDTLSEVLPQQHGIKYVWMGKELGGLRKRNKDMHCNDGWENFSFRGALRWMHRDSMHASTHEQYRSQVSASACIDLVSHALCILNVYKPNVVCRLCGLHAD